MVQGVVYTVYPWVMRVEIIFYKEKLFQAKEKLNFTVNACDIPSHNHGLTVIPGHVTELTILLLRSMLINHLPVLRPGASVLHRRSLVPA